MDKIKNFKSLCSGVMRISTPGKFSYDFYSGLKNYIGNTQDIDTFVSKLGSYKYKNKSWFNIVNDNTTISNISGNIVEIAADKFDYPSKNNKFMRIDIFELNNGDKEAFIVAKNDNQYTFCSLSRTTANNDFSIIYFYDGKFSSSLQQFLGINTDIKRVKSINLNFKKSDNSTLYIDKFLDKNQYNSTNKVTKKLKIFLHHTAGGGNPLNVINDWNTDTRGRVATAFVIGGKIKDSDKYDGKIYRCFEEEFYAGHLGLDTKTISRLKNKYADLKNLNINDEKIKEISIGIEICNWGFVEKGGFTNNKGEWVSKESNKFYVYTGNEFPFDENHIYDLGNNLFRGKRYFHKYTDNQLNSISQLLYHLSSKFNIPLKNIIWNQKSFDINSDAYDLNVKGLFTHTNVREDKTDCHPQKELIDLLNGL